MKLFKNIILVFLFLSILNVAQAQTLKGLLIGEKHNGNKEIKTTVGGYSGTLTVLTLKDSTIMGLHFLSTEDIKNEIDFALSLKNADEFLNNIEWKYKVKFSKDKWTHKKFSEGEIHNFAFVTKNKIQYGVMHLTFRNEGTSKVVFTITDKELNQKAVNERYFGKMDDF